MGVGVRVHEGVDGSWMEGMKSWGGFVGIWGGGSNARTGDSSSWVYCSWVIGRFRCIGDVL